MEEIKEEKEENDRGTLDNYRKFLIQSEEPVIYVPNKWQGVPGLHLRTHVNLPEHNNYRNKRM